MTGAVGTLPKLIRSDGFASTQECSTIYTQNSPISGITGPLAHDNPAITSCRSGAMNDKLDHFEISQHAKVRASQRGFTKCRLTLAIRYADMFVSVGRDLNASRLSRHALAEAMADGIPPAEAERLKRLTIIEADDGAVVTVAVPYGKKGRHYKRRMRRY
ncbi:hypothetical protein [Sphingobium tyrosinilyticum]|uniref:DUF4258 domain-containing protein n=1 Tax=Sphingobium tyrosinilyticum TaxID=2715436 RepID=A0ABV9F0V3_9SPHN